MQGRPEFRQAEAGASRTCVYVGQWLVFSGWWLVKRQEAGKTAGGEWLRVADRRGELLYGERRTRSPKTCHGRTTATDQ